MSLRMLLKQMCVYPGHQFRADDISLRDTTLFPTFVGSKQLTDAYLLGLAVEHRAKLATLHRRIDPSTVLGGNQAYFKIP
ncbi:MAG: type II toxin-antitoxin system VapC family toxin [Verrucomicrobia bacterium]|nr:type II toxin-antitoxin system VapC family toxin [Verrucomicrobiota bacterium]